MVAQVVDEEHVEDQKYVSVRLNVYTKNLRTVSEDGSGLKLKLALSTAIYRYETLDELFARETEHINALGVRPKMEFEYLTPVENVFFVPDLELAVNRSFDTSNKGLSAAA